MVFDVNILPSLWTILGLAVSSSVAIVALYLGWRSNRELYKIRGFEKQENFIKEIIGWAEVITIFISEQIVSRIDDEEIIHAETGYRLRELNGLSVTGIYIESMAPRLLPNNTDLLRDIQKFRLRINRHSRLLALVVCGKIKKGNVEKATTNHFIKLRDDALNLIDLATRIYTEIK